MLKSLGIALFLLAGSSASGLPLDRHSAKPAPIEQDKARAKVGPAILSDSGYIEYLPGNAPIIITAPHGGVLSPESIPTRVPENCGGKATVVMDRNTGELAKQIRDSFFKRYGVYPYVVVSRIARRKVDLNRPIEEAACGSGEAEQAFRDWHRFIDQAKSEVVRDFKKGWFLDVHGHAHDIPRVEIGYLLTAANLALDDDALNAGTALRDRSSIRTVAAVSGAPLSELLRGPHAIGSILQREGFRAVPSDKEPNPGDAKYFSAGYNTLRHGCSARAQGAGGDPSGVICSLQFETNYKGLRDTPGNRARFGDATALAFGEFLGRYYDLGLTGKGRRSDR